MGHDSCRKSLSFLAEQTDQDGDQQAEGDAQQVGVQVGGVGGTGRVDAGLEGLENESHQVGQQGRKAEGAPPGAEVESQGSQDREGEEHGEVDALVDRDAENGAWNVGVGRECAETEPGDQSDISHEKQDFQNPYEGTHEVFLLFLRWSVWKSFSALILSMMVVTTS